MNEIVRRYDVIGICDGNESKQGTSMFGYTVGKVTDYITDSYDHVVVTPSYTESITQSLIDAGIDEKKIIMLEDALAIPSCTECFSDCIENLSGSCGINCEKNNISGCNVAIIFYGGLGDYIIGKNWLYHLEESVDLSGARVDALFSENTMENAHAIFDDSKLIRQIMAIDTSTPDLVDINRYDLVMSYSIFPMVRYLDQRSLEKENAKLYSYASNIKKFGDEHYNVGIFSSPDFHKTVNSLFELFSDKKYHGLYDVLSEMSDTEDYHCTYSIGIDEDEYLLKQGLKKARYITVNTGANEEYSRKPSTRTWQHANWLKLITLLKENLSSDIQIVRMGLADPNKGETDADIDLCGKTSVEEAKVLLKNSLVHIDYEGGLVHLRHVLCGGPSVVLHGPTSVERYGYPENYAIRSDECPKACEWSTRDWLTVCHNGCNPFACMRSISPEYVLEITMNVIEKEKL